VVFGGFGRVGGRVGQALAPLGIPYIVVEMDPDVVASLRASSVPCLYGDAAHEELLERAGVARASLVVFTIPDVEHARLAVSAARSLNPHVPILARAHGRAEGAALEHSGATEVIQPEVEAAGALVRHALALLAPPTTKPSPEHEALA
jgi:CPA2 family monovalent cation:H+ antiporter-2